MKNFNARILLVDDYPVNQELTKEMLEMLGCVVVIAQNGFEALELLKKQQFNLIFMDIQMPEMDGFDCTRIIRQQEASYRNIPIVALTANAIQGDRERCLAEGMNEYISKPFRLANLEFVLDSFLITDAEYSGPTHPA